jgi:hypothetical protein
MSQFPHAVELPLVVTVHRVRIKTGIRILPSTTGAPVGLLHLDIVGQSGGFGEYQNWKLCPERPLPGTLLLSIPFSLWRRASSFPDYFTGEKIRAGRLPISRKETIA